MQCPFLHLTSLCRNLATPSPVHPLAINVFDDLRSRVSRHLDITLYLFPLIHWASPRSSSQVLNTYNMEYKNINISLMEKAELLLLFVGGGTYSFLHVHVECKS